MNSPNGVTAPPSAWEQVAKEFDCPHNSRVFVSWINANSAQYYGLQCRNCGDTQSVRRSQMQWHPSQAIPKNESLKDSWWRRKQARYEEVQTLQKEAENKEWRTRYNAHLNSSKWYDLRKKVFERAQGICEGCGKDRPVHVHYLTYEHLGDEFLWELAAVCLRCHERCHGT